MTHSNITRALNDLVFAPDPAIDLIEVVDRYFATGYTHRADGRILDREQFVEMATAIRSRLAGGSVTRIDELRLGDRYAKRHSFHLTLDDGTTQHREVSVFGTIDEEGRFLHLSETGFDLPAYPETDPR